MQGNLTALAPAEVIVLAARFSWQMRTRGCAATGAKVAVKRAEATWEGVREDH